jgi:8-oxo-dGTP pyrophosphatase MutT (NUDIX family)
LYSYIGDRRLPAFSDIKTVRAGFLVILRTHDIENDIQCNELLVVKEKGNTCYKNGILQTIPPRLGPPKGSAEQCDISALDTAKRELFEETGINVHDPAIDAKLLETTFIYYRPKVSEIIVYFVIFISKMPKISLCTRELLDYQWIDMAPGLRRITDVTDPTSKIFSLLDNYGIHQIKLDNAISLAKLIIAK